MDKPTNFNSWPQWKRDQWYKNQWGKCPRCDGIESAPMDRGAPMPDQSMICDCGSIADVGFDLRIEYE